MAFLHKDDKSKLDIIRVTSNVYTLQKGETKNFTIDIEDLEDDYGIEDLEYYDILCVNYIRPDYDFSGIGETSLFKIQATISYSGSDKDGIHIVMYNGDQTRTSQQMQAVIWLINRT